MSEKILEQPLSNITQVDDDKSELIELSELPPELLEAIETSGIDQDKKIKLVQAIVTSEFNGPLPHPNILQGYERVVPGAADRIISMAESEAGHRHTLDNKCVKTDSRDSLMGIISAFILCMTCVIGGIYVIVNIPNIGGILSGLLLSGGGISGIIVAFLKGTKTTWKMDKKE